MAKKTDVPHEIRVCNKSARAVGALLTSNLPCRYMKVKSMGSLRSDWSSGKDSSLKPQIGQSGWGRPSSREGTRYAGEKLADCRNEVSLCIAHHIVAVPPGRFRR
jgi:hypothetical protein